MGYIFFQFYACLPLNVWQISILYKGSKIVCLDNNKVGPLLNVEWKSIRSVSVIVLNSTGSSWVALESPKWQSWESIHERNN